MPSRGKLLPRDCQGIFSRNLVLVCLYSTLPQEVPYLLLNPQSLKLGGVERKKRKYISEYELAFRGEAWDVGYLIHLCFYPHPIKPTRTRKTSKTSTRRKSHRIQRGKNFPGYVWMMIPPTNAPAVRRASPQGIGQRPVSLPEPPPSPVLQTAPQVAEPPFRQPPTLAEGATGYNPPDATTADIMRPKLQPPLLVSTTVGGEGDFGIKQRLHTPPESWRERHHYGCLLEKSSNLPCKRRTVIAIKLLELIATSLSHQLTY